MTPAARISAAIDLLDAHFSGAPIEQALTRWARSNRYAGSKDRAAIRDLVFDGLRRRRSYAWLGGAESGRSVMIGAMRASGQSPGEYFTGDRFAPSPLTDAERTSSDILQAPDPVRYDCQDWLFPKFAESCADPVGVLHILQSRAGVFLRVNIRKSSREEATALLKAEGIAVSPVEDMPTALEVTENPRRVSQSEAYKTGLVEIQDTSSQIAVGMLPLQEGMKVLDLCAGGGGKSLAMAARAKIDLFAHDISAARMADLPARAARAGVDINILQPGQIEGSFDLILIDAPCSGSGTWRRTPEAKWRLTPDRLTELCQIQASLLQQARAHLSDAGHIAYATCSVFKDENDHQIAGLDVSQRIGEPQILRLLPGEKQDGFFLAVL